MLDVIQSYPETKTVFRAFRFTLISDWLEL
jgi:hypothetical protein